VDTSNLCDICDPIHPETATISGDTTICNSDATNLSVIITGGWTPYTVVYSNGASNVTVNNYTSGDPISITPSSTTTYTLVSITDLNACTADPDSLFGTVTVTVEGPLAITSNPVSVQECSGNGASFASAATNGGAGTAFFQWQYSSNGGTNFYDLADGTPYSNVTTNTMSISDVAGLNAYQYRVKVFSGVCDTIFSTAATLTVEGPIAITGNPSDVTLCETSSTTFSSGASNSGVGTLNTIWQVSTDNGSTWSDLVNGGNYANVTAATLNVNSIPAAFDGYQYRMKASTAQCTAMFSSPAILTVEGAIAITADPVAVSACAGNSVIFVVGTSNQASGTIAFQWQESQDHGNTWADLTDAGVYNGVQTDTLSVSDVIGRDSFQYRVCINTSTCSTICSNAALLSVDGPITYSDAPDDVTLCDGDQTTFAATAVIGQGTIVYQWQVSLDNGLNWSNLTNNSNYLNVATNILTVQNIPFTFDGNRYRVNAFTTQCDTVSSTAGILTVEGPISVNTHPLSVTECSGNSTFFSAVIDNPGAGNIIYKWQVSVDGGSTWLNLANTGVYNGASSSQLSINNVAGLYDYQYRLSAKTSTCSIIYTNPATLTVEGPIVISGQPVDANICANSDTTFTVAVTNQGSGTMSLQWQVSSDAGVNWLDLSADSTYAGVDSTTLVMTDVESGFGGRCYRLEITTGACTAADAFYSDMACLTVEGPIAFTTQPADFTQCSESPVTFTAGVSNGGTGTLLWQWQESTNGTTWNDLVNDANYNGVQTDTLSISNVASKGGNKYRTIVATGQCSTITSTAATLTVEGPITFLVQPQDTTQCSGSTVTFDATVSNAGSGTLALQWEVSTDGGITWNALANDGVYNGVTTNSLAIVDVAGKYDYQYRAVASTATCTAIPSQAATLTVEGPIAITSQPSDVTNCSDQGVSFSVITANTGSGQIDHQWQFSSDGGTTWLNLSNSSIYNGATTATLSISNVAGLNQYQYRVIIQTSTCSSITSTPATLTEEGPLTFTSMPTDVVECSGNGAAFSAAITNGTGEGTITHQWQVSSDGINWTNLANSAPYSGVTTTTLTISDVAGLTGKSYRLQSTTGTCSAANSDPALLTVEGPLAIADQPDNFTTCSDLGVFFAVSVTNPGQGFIFYQWQESTDGSTWNNLTNTGNFNGVHTDTLSIDVVAGLGNNQYRVLVNTATCDTLTSTVGSLTVEGPLTISDEPDDVTICSGSGTSFSVGITNPGAGSILYQWEVSANGGATWSSLSNGGVNGYTGVTTATLGITDVVGLGGYKYRVQASTPNCASTVSVAATLAVEGPIFITTNPSDVTICSNLSQTISAVVGNSGSGVLSMVWQESQNGGATWANLSNGGNYSGALTQDLAIALTEGMDTYQYRLVLSTSVCNDTTAVAILNVLDACSDGSCDFDLDGADNANDADDDNDGLADVWEDYLVTQGGLNYDNCNTDSDGDGIRDDLEDPDGDLINNGEETDGDGVFDGDPLDPCDPVLSPACIGITIYVKVMLQGALIGTSDTLMRDDLRQLGLIPLTEPYTALSGFEHVGLDGGGETIADSAAVLGVTGPDAIVDWVFIELRSSIKLDSVIATRSALLQRDGDVVSQDGVSPLTFVNTLSGPYYVAVRHRNHLGVMTNSAGNLSPIPSYFDFTDTTFVTNGTNAEILLPQNGSKYAMWAGDLNHDGKSIYQGPGNDILELFATVLADADNNDNLANFISTGYLDGDIDLDGEAIYQGPGNDRNRLLFSIILPYPENGSNLANYVILQQLP